MRAVALARVAPDALERGEPGRAGRRGCKRSIAAKGAVVQADDASVQAAAHGLQLRTRSATRSKRGPLRGCCTARRFRDRHALRGPGSRCAPPVSRPDALRLEAALVSRASARLPPLAIEDLSSDASRQETRGLDVRWVLTPRRDASVPRAVESDSCVRAGAIRRAHGACLRRPSCAMPQPARTQSPGRSARGSRSSTVGDAGRVEPRLGALRTSSAARSRRCTTRTKEFSSTRCTGPRPLSRCGVQPAARHTRVCGARRDRRSGLPPRRVHVQSAAREPFRHTSLVAGVALGTVAGLRPRKATGWRFAGLVTHLEKPRRHTTQVRMAARLAARRRPSRRAERPGRANPATAGAPQMRPQSASRSVDCRRSEEFDACQGRPGHRRGGVRVDELRRLSPGPAHGDRRRSSCRRTVARLRISASGRALGRRRRPPRRRRRAGAGPPVPSACRPSCTTRCVEGQAHHVAHVGTFYRSPAPDADPFVEVGDVVEVGQTLYYRGHEAHERDRSRDRGRVARILSRTRRRWSSGRSCSVEPI